MKNDRIKDEDRHQWIQNDEGLYDMARESNRRGIPMSRFIRDNRAIIDEVIHNVRDGVKPAHYLTYHHGTGCPCAHCKGRAA